jgi:hypothetical protein
MAKNKKQHDQEQYSSHEGFRENTIKYSYSFEFMGRMETHETNEEEHYEVGQEYDGKRIRRIQNSWMYGKYLTLIHLEKI